MRLDVTLKFLVDVPDPLAARSEALGVLVVETTDGEEFEPVMETPQDAVAILLTAGVRQLVDDRISSISMYSAGVLPTIKELET